MGKKLALFFVAAMASVFLFSAGTYAFTYLNAGATVAPDQVIDGALVAVGENVVVEGTVKGDLICAGQTVQIKGVVEGDVLCAGQSVTVSATVVGDVRVAAQTFNLESSVDKSLTVFAQTATLAQNSFVGFDATVFAETANINGNISRDLVANVETLNLAGGVFRLVQANVTSFNIAATAIVGDVYYVSYDDANVADGATVAILERSAPQVTTAEPTNPIITILVGAAYAFVSMLLIGVAILIVKPQILPAAADRINLNPLAAIGWGALFVFFAPAVALLVGLTLVGIPLAAVILLAWLIVLIVAQPIAGYFIGGWLMSKTKIKMSDTWLKLTSLALGLLVIVLVTLIPFIGWLLGLIASCLGAGSLKQSKKVKA